MGGSQWPFYRLPNAKRGLSRPSACIRIVLPSQQGTCTAYFILRRNLFSNYFSSHLTKAARIGAPPIAPHSHLSFSRPLSSTLNTRTIFLFLFFSSTFNVYVSAHRLVFSTRNLFITIFDSVYRTHLAIHVRHNGIPCYMSCC
jgi:hypothetical protein